MSNVVIYTTPTCPYCKMAKAFFQQHNIRYQEKDVMIDLQAREEMVQKSGQLGVPVIEVGGKIIVGFDQRSLRELLKIG